MMGRATPAIQAGNVPAAPVKQKMLLLVDFENVPKFSLADAAKDESVSIIIYVGASQKAIPLDLVTTAQPWGDRIHWQPIDASGPNALDFFIACKLGQVLETSRHTVCIVLSKDKGFDPLIRHLSKLGLKCARLERIGPAPQPASKTPAAAPQPSTPVTSPKILPPTAGSPKATIIKSPPKKAKAASKSAATSVTTSKPASLVTKNNISAAYERIVTTLRNSAKARPAKRTTLKKHISAMFQNNITDAEVEKIIALLETSNRIKLTDGNVTYKL